MKKIPIIKIKPIRFHYHLDSDKDRVPDYKDCRPFNPFKQHLSKTMKRRIQAQPIYVTDEPPYADFSRIVPEERRIYSIGSKEPVVERTPSGHLLPIVDISPSRTYKLGTREADKYAPKSSRMLKSVFRQYPSAMGDIERTQPEKVVYSIRNPRGREDIGGLFTTDIDNEQLKEKGTIYAYGSYLPKPDSNAPPLFSKEKDIKDATDEEIEKFQKEREEYWEKKAKKRYDELYPVYRPVEIEQVADTIHHEARHQQQAYERGPEDYVDESLDTEYGQHMDERDAYSYAEQELQKYRRRNIKPKDFEIFD